MGKAGGGPGDRKSAPAPGDSSKAEISNQPIESQVFITQDKGFGQPRTYLRFSQIVIRSSKLIGIIPTNNKTS
ncbi:unnamed protein product [Larinioides sclopetarius]|uniref:Uncharacterized protein n=1 Tax=Larinioides sclopetarius TaxID=280406 RepID=A0AAV2B465_9ARAC